jgi:predicted dehydrogenase
MAKRIGFVDYNPDNFHANIFLKFLREDLSARGFTVSGCHALLDSEAKEWSSKNEVCYFESPDELNENVDVFAVLAPSNPEVHLDLCERVLKFGKTTYVDKTFAPSLEVAEQIFGLADEHGTAIQTTSSLRYTEVQDFVYQNGGREAVRHMISWGPGGSFGEYAIHPVETIISCMGEEALALIRRNDGDFSQLIINFSDSRTAVVNVCTNSKTAYSASVTTAEQTAYIPVDTGKLFLNMTSSMLDFFAAGEPSIPRAESLMIRQILDAAMRPEACESFVDLA